jgi:hypothetical protein
MSLDWNNLLGDPLFQMNLSLWLAQPRPIGYTQTPRPLLREAGFEVYYIEPPFSLPIEIRKNLLDAKIAIGDRAEPDIVFRGAKGEIMIWECKRSLFGYDKKKTAREHKQARIFLLATPALLQSVLGLAPGQPPASSLTYFVKKNASVEQLDGLLKLAGELQKANFSTNPLSALLLCIRDHRLLLTAKPSAKALPATLQKHLGAEDCEILKITEPDTDPRPLYYFPWMPESDPDPTTSKYGQIQFGNRILGAVAQQLGFRKVPYTAEVYFESLLQLVYNAFFSNWRNKKQLGNLKAEAFKIIKAQLVSVNTKKEEEKLSVSSELAAGSLGKLIVTVPTQKLHQRALMALSKWPGTIWFEPMQDEIVFPEDPVGASAPDAAPKQENTPSVLENLEEPLHE